MTLRYDHSFWTTHFPPNGWGCHCYIIPVAGPLPGDTTEPPEGWDTRNSKGDLPGIDKGFDYAPGANANRPLQDFIDQKLIKLDAPIGAAMWENLQPVLAGEMRQAVAEMVDAAMVSQQPAGLAALVHVVSPRTVADLAARGVPMESADVWLRDEELLHALRDTKAARDAVLPMNVWRALPDFLANATPYLDTHDAALVYAFDLPEGVGKVLVRVNYADKVRVQGKRTKITSNFVRTGGVVDPTGIRSGSQFAALKK